MFLYTSSLMAFSSTAVSIADLNLVLQVTALALVIIGWRRAVKKRVRQHGQIMAVAVVLNLVSILLIMGPSFFLGLGFIMSNPFNTISVVSISHHGLGLLAELLGLYLVYKWRFQKTFTFCYGHQNLMKITIITWVITNILGIVIYVYLFL
jgi:uncharacterized membrane protein YozB (DUF420 family)